MMMLKTYLRKLLMMKGVSRVFKGCFKSVSRVFQGCLKLVLRVFKVSFMGV